MLRFPQLVFTKYAATPPRCEPTPRMMSPCGGRSTLTTSAPCWASSIVPYGPDRLFVRSMTRTPESGPPELCVAMAGDPTEACLFVGRSSTTPGGGETGSRATNGDWAQSSGGVQEHCKSVRRLGQDCG